MRSYATNRQSLILAVAGVVYAMLMAAVLQMQLKYVIAAFIGIAILSAAILLKDHLKSFFLYILVLNIPVVTFDKALYLKTEPRWHYPGIGFGAADILLLILYGLWLKELYQGGKWKWPALSKLDWHVLAFYGANVLSVANSKDLAFALFGMVVMTKMLLLYFYLSRNIQRHDIKFIVICLGINILGQFPIGLIQYYTGQLMGLGEAKGVVEGFEQFATAEFDYPRMEGTVGSSHAFANFIGLMAPIFLSFALSTHMPVAVRCASTVVFLVGCLCSLLAFSRGGWVGLGVGALLVCAVYAYLRQWQALRRFSLLSLLVVPLVVAYRNSIFQRLLDAPPEMASGRLDMAKEGLLIIKQHILLGSGVNTPIFLGEEFDNQTLHVVYLLVAAQVGIIGLICFIGILVFMFIHGFRLLASKDLLVRSVVIGLLGGLTSAVTQGFSDFTLSIRQVFYMFWFMAGFIEAIHQFTAPTDLNTVIRS